MQLIVIRCDTQVHGVDELEEPDDLLGLREKLNQEGIGGGGGSNMRPIFTKLEEMEIQPDVLVVLTDLYADLPASQPDYPVVWACTTDKQGPWGDTVRLEV
jgi:predicted metal-dependent peptidase